MEWLVYRDKHEGFYAREVIKYFDMIVQRQHYACPVNVC